jgi:preprotein translocase subunit YajC
LIYTDDIFIIREGEMNWDFDVTATLIIIALTAIGVIAGIFIPFWFNWRKKEKKLQETIDILKKGEPTITNPSTKLTVDNIQEMITKENSFLVEGKEFAELMVELMVKNIDKNTTISCVFHSFTLPKDAMERIEIAIAKGVRFNVLMPNLPESKEGIEWFIKQ